MLPACSYNGGTGTGAKLTPAFARLSVVDIKRAGCIYKSLCAGGLHSSPPAAEEEANEEEREIVTNRLVIGVNDLCHYPFEFLTLSGLKT